MKSLPIAAGTILGLALTVSLAEPAHADHTYGDHSSVSVTKVERVFPGSTRILVTLSSEKMDVLNPCRAEYGRHCYWDKKNVANGEQGTRSFVVTRGIVFYVSIPAK